VKPTILVQNQNKMKNLAIILFGALLSTSTMAQTEPNYGADKDKCLEKVSLYSGYLKQKMYKDAYKFWGQAVETCPEYGTNLYANGVYILKQLRKDKTISKEQKKRYTDSIITVYEAGIKIFGGTPEILESYGAALVIYGKQYKKGTDNLKEAIDGLRHEIKYSTYIYYSQALSKLERKKEVDCELLVKEYDRLSQFIEMNKDAKNIGKSQEAIDKYLGPCLTCDKLLPVMEKKLEEAKTNDDLRKKVLKLLNDRKCTDNNVFEVLAVIEADKNPSVDAYEALAEVFKNKKENKKALMYLEKAIDLEEDVAKKEILMLKATTVASSSKKGSLANDILKLNPNNGDAYLIKANIAGRSGCGNSAFERTTKNWVAYDIAAKAKKLDPSVSAKAGKAMGSYRARFPEKSELFAQGLKEGQSYKTCLGVSTTVRAR
jgi:tetratricopeptide (TPR) repeat protein